MSEVTINMLQKYLKKYGWQKFETASESGEKEGIIITGWSSGMGTRPHVLVIDPIVEKHVVYFFVPKIVSLPVDSTPEKYLREFLIALGTLNYVLLLGKFEYDPRDGEVRFGIVVPTDHSMLTYEQFEHCLRVIVTTVDTYEPVLLKIAQGVLDHRAVLNERGSTFLQSF